MRLSDQTTIFHITSHAQWEAAQAAGAYRGDTLDSEGFIHCSTAPQIVATAARFFRGQRDLVLLRIDTDKLRSDLRYEPASNGELFPHIYGPLNVDAVSHVYDFPPRADGSFALPLSLVRV